MEKIIHSLFKITQDVTGFVLKTEFFFLGFNFLKANSHHENIKKRKVVVACKNLLKLNFKVPVRHWLGGGGEGKGGNLFGGGGETRGIMGNAQMTNRDLFLRDR